MSRAAIARDRRRRTLSAVPQGLCEDSHAAAIARRARAPMHCPDCRTLNGPSDRACHVCGRDLEDLRAGAPVAVVDEPDSFLPEPDDDLPPNVLRPHELRAAIGGPAAAPDATAMHLARKPDIAPEDAVRCPSCGASNLPGVRRCRLCGLDIPEDDEAVEALRTGPAWEIRRGAFDLRALWKTTVEVLLAPRRSFERMRRRGGLEAPLGYFVAIWLVLLPLWVPVYWTELNEGLVRLQTPDPRLSTERQQQLAEAIEFVRNALGGEIDGDELERRLEELDRERRNPGQPAPGTPGTPPASATTPATPTKEPFQISFTHFVLASPFLLVAALLSLFISAALLHLSLRMVGAGRGGLEQSFRACAYAAGPVLAVSLVPFLGPALAPIVRIVLLALGMSRLHDVPVGRVIGGWIFFAVMAGLATCGATATCVGGMAVLQ